MGEQITVNVINGDIPLLSNAPSLSNEHSERCNGYGALMARAMFNYLMAVSRLVEWKPSPPENHRVFMISGYAAFLAVVCVTYTMLMEQERSHPTEGINYTYLKFIGNYSAFLTSFSILMSVLPPEFNWIGYLAAWVMFGILVTCFYLDDQQDIGPPICSDVILFIIPIVLFFCLMPLPPTMFLLQVTLWIEIAHQLITYLRFIYVKTRKAEALQPIQQDENTRIFPSTGYSYMMPIRSSSD